MQKCQVEKLFLFLRGSSQQGKINVKTVHFEVTERKSKKDAGQEKVNFARASDLSLIKHHATKKDMTLYKHLVYIDFVSCNRQF